MSVVKKGDPRHRGPPTTTGSVPTSHIETVQTHRGPVQVRVKSKSPILRNVAPSAGASATRETSERDRPRTGGSPWGRSGTGREAPPAANQRRPSGARNPLPSGPPPTIDLSQQIGNLPDVRLAPQPREERRGCTGRPSASSTNEPLLRAGQTTADTIQEWQRVNPGFVSNGTVERYDISSNRSDRSRTSRSNQFKAQQLAIELDIREQIANARHQADLLELRLERERNIANLEGSQGSVMSESQIGSVQRLFDSVNSMITDTEAPQFTQLLDNTFGTLAPSRTQNIADGAARGGHGAVNAPLTNVPRDPSPSVVGQISNVYAGVPVALGPPPAMRATSEQVARPPQGHMPVGSDPMQVDGDVHHTLHLTENHAHDNREIHMNAVQVQSTVPVEVLRDHDSIVNLVRYQTRLDTEVHADRLWQAKSAEMKSEHAGEQEALVAALSKQQQATTEQIVEEAERRHSIAAHVANERHGMQLVQEARMPNL